MIKAIKKIFKWLLIGLLVFGVVWAICTFIYTFRVSYQKAKESPATEAGEVAFSALPVPEQEVFSLRFDDLPAYDGAIAIEINGNQPELDSSSFGSDSHVTLSELDSLGRPGPATAIIGQDIMPTEPRGEIGQVRPAGWHTIRYDDLIEDRYLYNRCHIIGYQLCGINSDIRDLFTGTRYLNIYGMLPFENEVARYVRRTGDKVLYRVTPIYHNDELVARGIQMEAISLGDAGASLCFNVFVYNIQPGIVIDYADGASHRSD